MTRTELSLHAKTKAGGITMEKSKLLRCPFCGGGADIYSVDEGCYLSKLTGDKPINWVADYVASHVASQVEVEHE